MIKCALRVEQVERLRGEPATGLRGTSPMGFDPSSMKRPRPSSGPSTHVAVSLVISATPKVVMLLIGSRPSGIRNHAADTSSSLVENGSSSATSTLWIGGQTNRIPLTDGSGSTKIAAFPVAMVSSCECLNHALTSAPL